MTVPTCPACEMTGTDYFADQVEKAVGVLSSCVEIGGRDVDESERILALLVADLRSGSLRRA